MPARFCRWQAKQSDRLAGSGGERRSPGTVAADQRKFQYFARGKRNVFHRLEPAGKFARATSGDRGVSGAGEGNTFLTRTTFIRQIFVLFGTAAGKNIFGYMNACPVWEKVRRHNINFSIINARIQQELFPSEPYQQSALKRTQDEIG